MRFTAILLAALLLAGIIMPALPAAAMSTAKEVAQGQDINKQIADENTLVTDPFLTNWVNGIGAKLAENRYRTDINYRFEILNTDEINAFALPGGFMHADMGLLNFVGSDDELAAVLGHEMGHVERRHVVTLSQKATVLGILIGVISILSPIASMLGGYGGDLAFGKFSRQDELQADRYGLLLMSRAGYDPQSNVDLMAHLGKMEGNAPESRADKALRSHPPPQDRIAHLMGYPELNNPSVDQIVAEAIHDESEGRYSYARARLELALKRSPNHKLAESHLATVQVALHDAGVQVSELHPRSVAFFHELDAFSIGDTATRLAKAQAITRDDAGLARDRAKSARGDMQTLFNSLEGQTHSIPNLGPSKKKGNNLSKAIAGLAHITRDINDTLNMSQDVLGTAPGLIAENLGPLKDMADSISDGPPTAKTRALLPQYPSIAANLSAGSDQLVSAVDDARASIAMGSDSVHKLSDFLAALNALDTTRGDIADKDMGKVQIALDAAAASWDAVAAMALKAANITYAAQTETLSTQITLLDLFSSRERYEAYRRALAFRFPGVQTPDYQTVLNSGVTPGELGCTTWIAYETKDRVSTLLRNQRATGLACADLALRRNLFTESMEVAEGLLYEDYIEVPEKV